MASSSNRKRQLCDMVAYVMQISSAKKAKSARLQLQVGKNEVKRAICFDMGKIEALKDKKDSCEPMKLQNVVFEKQNNPAFAEIIINTKTSICEPQPNDVSFSRHEPVLTTISISQINNPKIGEVLAVRGLFTNTHSKYRVAEVFGRSSNICENNYISDASGTISFTVWDQWIPFFTKHKENGNEHFLFYNVLVKEFDSKIFLTTFSDTYVEVDDSPPTFNANIPIQIDEEETVVLPCLNLIGKFRYSYLCLKCGKNIYVNKTEAVVKCKICHVTQRSDCLEKYLDVEVGSATLGEKMYVMSYNDITKIWPASSSDIDVFEVDEDAVSNVLLSAQDIVVICNNETYKLTPWDRHT